MTLGMVVLYSKTTEVDGDFASCELAGNQILVTLTTFSGSGNRLEERQVF